MSTTEPPWASKVGTGALPGFSPNPAPSLASEFGAVIAAVGGDLTVVIDAERYIYGVHGDRALAYKVDELGAFAWKFLTTEKLGAFASSGALHAESFLLASVNGWAVSLDAATGKERWSKKFAEGGSVADQSAIVASGGSFIVPGKDEASDQPLAFNRDVFCLDARTGNTKWKVKMKLGLLNFVPNILGDLVVFQSINGEVACHRLADGAQKWATAQSGQPSTGGVVACKETNLVYSTANLRGKKEWNKPRGGRGSLRAFSLQTGELMVQFEEELECNAAPLVAPVGPGGQLLLIYGIGANPGTWKEPTGDDWPALVVARDASTGHVVWHSEKQHHRGMGPGGTDGSARFRNQQACCWSSATASADGRVFIAWHGSACLELEGATGRKVAELGDQAFLCSSPALAPDLMALPARSCLYIFPGRRIRGTELRPLQIPLSESGCQHFWPHKMQNLQHTEFTELPAITDISSQPSCISVDITRHPFRLASMDFYHKTPVVDSQRNVYLATNAGRTLVVRPDGTIRATIPTGVFCSNHCLHDRYLYAVNGGGFLVKVDIETLEVVVNKKIFDYTASDSWNPCVSEKHGLLLAAGMHRSINQSPVGGNFLIVGCRIIDGSVAWVYILPWMCYNFLPTIIEDKDLLIFADNAGGLYCLNITDGTELWKDLTIPENIGAFTTGHCSSGPNGMVYNAYNLKSPPDLPLGLWNKGAGGGGVVRANVIETGERKWLRNFDFECHVAPVVVPKTSPGGGYLVVVAQGSQGGFAAPEDGKPPDDESTNWPTGDAWESRFLALDAETGDEVWRLELPVWCHYEARGSCHADIFLPDCFGSPTASANGHVYCIHWSGTAYCVESATGKLVSEVDVGASSQSAPVILPGTLLLPTALDLRFYRSKVLEEAWLEQARAAGDPRADPRLWEPREQRLTPADKEALALSLNASPNRGVFPEFEYRTIGPPVPAFGKEAHEARSQRLLKKYASTQPADDSSPPTKAESQPKAQSQSQSQSQSGEGDRPLWEVVGGGKTGGITVRKDQALKSAELGQLSKGAQVRQLGLEGQRLHYALVPGTGTGPEQGWVSLTFKGSELLKRL